MKNRLIAQEIILNTFSFLEEEYFYTYKIEENQSTIFNDIFTVEYINQIKRRTIKITYTEGEVYGDRVFTFSILIGRLPYSGSEDLLSVHDYLLSLNQGISIRFVNSFNKSQAEKLLNKMTDKLKNHLIKVIDGKEWLEEYYPKKD